MTPRTAMQKALAALRLWKDEAPHAWSIADDEAVAALKKTLPDLQPLDEEWITYCWRKSLIGFRISYAEYLGLVREVERAHKIGVAK